MDKISYSGKIFTYFEYAKEHDFEKDVIEHANEIFSPSYFLTGGHSKRNRKQIIRFLESPIEQGKIQRKTIKDITGRFGWEEKGNY